MSLVRRTKAVPTPPKVQLHRLYPERPVSRVKFRLGTVCTDPEEYPRTVTVSWLPIETMTVAAPYNQEFRTFCKELETTHQVVGWKRSRGDGNCYYRAVGHAYLEWLARPATPQTIYKLVELLETTQLAEVNPVYDQAKEYALLCLKELAKLQETDVGQAFKQTLAYLQDSCFDRALVYSIRLLSAAYLVKHSEDENISLWLVDGLKAELDLILTEDQEAEGFGLLIVPLALEVQVVQYHFFNKVVCQKYPEDSAEIVLNIVNKARGHYDMLYLQEDCRRDGYKFDCGEYNLLLSTQEH